MWKKMIMSKTFVCLMFFVFFADWLINIEVTQYFAEEPEPEIIA